MKFLKFFRFYAKKIGLGLGAGPERLLRIRNATWSSAQKYPDAVLVLRAGYNFPDVNILTSGVG